MELVELVADGDTVVGRFACSAAHRGEWRGHAPTGRRFEGVDEVYFFGFEGDRIVSVWGIEGHSRSLPPAWARAERR
jgi:predicted ester cyclase